MAAPHQETAYQGLVADLTVAARVLTVLTHHHGGRGRRGALVAAREPGGVAVCGGVTEIIGHSLDL